MSRATYLICAYKNPDQVVEMVESLDTKDVDFLIHIDRKSGHSMARAVERGLARLPNVAMLERRRIHWAGFQIVNIVLRTIRRLEKEGLDPDHLTVLSGQDLPIKSAESIATFLSANADRTFARHRALPDWAWLPHECGGLDRFDRVHVRLPRKGMVKTPIRRSLPDDYEPFGGSANVSLGRPQRRYIARLMREDRRLIRYFRWANVPDEIFFQTLLMNSPQREGVVNDDLFISRWKSGANHPDILSAEDFDILADSDALFARKFDALATPGIVEQVQKRFGGVDLDDLDSASAANSGQGNQ